MCLARHVKIIEKLSEPNFSQVRRLTLAATLLAAKQLQIKNNVSRQLLKLILSAKVIQYAYLTVELIVSSALPIRIASSMIISYAPVLLLFQTLNLKHQLK